MALAPGATLGPYEIVSLLGRGGMGEVYRARDPRLGREVAIKVLADGFAGDAERRTRFEREARAVAALAHPNIVAVFDVGSDGPTLYLVTELLAGESLRDRIRAAPSGLPVPLVVSVAVQLARGLAAAHDRRIVHRDLKPENVFLLPDGRIKILDFGIARTIPGGSGTTETVAALTADSVVVGTAGYMAPEQLRGLEVDGRADLFALGAVVHETLTGRRAFGGETLVDAATSVLKDDPPPLSSIRGDVPASLDRIVRHCLQKDPADRFRSAYDVAFALEELLEPSAVLSAPTTSRSWTRWAGWAMAALVAVVGGLIWRTHPGRTEALLPVRFELTTMDKGGVVPGFFAVSPDGRRIAFSSVGGDGRSHLWLRSFDALEPKSFPATEGALSPFWSPDGRSIGFWADGYLKRIPVGGGPPEAICAASNRGASWNADGTIIFASNWVFKVPASGGTPVPLTELDPNRQELFHARPFFLPDGHHFLYVRASTIPENDGIFVGSIDAASSAQSRVRLLGGLIGPAYVATPGTRSGHLLFMRERQLLAQPFDPDRLLLSGDPVVVADAVGDNGNAIGFYSAVSGALAVQRSTSSGQLTWFDRKGTPTGRVGDPQLYDGLALSPDGRQAAVPRYASNHDVWIVDATRGTATRFTSDPAWDADPVWSPDGTRLVFASNRPAGVFDLFWKPSAGTTDESLLLQTPSSKTPTDWSRDGRFIVYTERNPSTREDIWVLENPDSPAAERRTWPVLATPFREGQARLSPDGHWMAYTSDESGRFEVYVRPFPSNGNGAKWLVSTAGGTQPRWRGDGRELLYISPKGTILAVAVTTANGFSGAEPQALFTPPLRVGSAGDIGISGRWDVTRDGQRVLAVADTQDEAAAPVSIVLNWQP